MNVIREADSTLTERYQTTVPASVREALKLGKRDKIHYTIRDSGEVVISRGKDDENDPIMKNFLEFLARDMTDHPEGIRAVTESTFARARELTADVEVNLDESLPDDDT